MNQSCVDYSLAKVGMRKMGRKTNGTQLLSDELLSREPDENES
jgi:hypothetical protein